MDFSDFENEIYYNHPGSSFYFLQPFKGSGSSGTVIYVFNTNRITRNAVDSLHNNGYYSDMEKEADYIWDDLAKIVVKDRDGLFVHPRWYITVTTHQNNGNSFTLNIPNQYQVNGNVFTTYSPAQQQAANSLSNAWAKVIGETMDNWELLLNKDKCECGLESIDEQASKVKCRRHSNWCDMYDSES